MNVLDRVRHPWGGYSHTLPLRACAAQRGRDNFEAPDLEQGNPFQRRFLEQGIIFNKMGNKKNVDHGFIFCLKLLLIMKKHLFDVY